MTEYRIVTKIDPSGVTQGRAKVSQELKGIQSEAAATGAAINRAFDQSQFDRSIGNLISRLDSLDKNMTEVASTSAAMAASNAKVVSSIDQLTGATTRAAGAYTGMGRGAAGAASSQSQLDSATRRVLQAVDQEAAEVMRLNSLLADAKRALDAGKISQEQYAAVQKMAAVAGTNQAHATAVQRMGMQQLGFQLGDVATMYSLGAKPAQIFGSQIGQVTQAVMMMTNGTSKFAAFLGGPWGIALSVGLILLAPFVGKLLEGNDALGEAVKKMKEDAKETELNRQAKEIFNRTLEGQIALQKDLNKELERNLQTQQQIDRGNLAKAYGSREGLYQQRNALVANLPAAQAEAKRASDAVRNMGVTSGPGTAQELARMAGEADRRVKEIQAQLKSVDAAIALAERSVRAAEIPIDQRRVKTSLDESAAATNRYQKRLGELNDSRIKGIISQREYNSALAYEEKLLKDTTEAIAKKKRTESAGDGVSRFKTQAQAVGMAGRELQSYGLRVTENEQFGGITPGAHKSSHKNAIDVNSGTGVVEANVPDLRKQFDGLARRYQARGYRVLWNGWVYEANGSGPTRRIPAGSDQHHDHMHVEAPGTIVGKATDASTEAQAGRDEKAAATAAEQQRDFVSNVVDQAAARGMPQGAETVAAQVAKQQADYKRRFNTDMSAADVKKVTGALTDAEAREQALNFDEAYVKPLERLKALQGKTGLDRQVLNAQLAESARIGKELTQPQKEQIENSIRHADAMQREADILASIRGPVDEYKAQIATLNTLLEKGQITQGQYNSRVSELGSAARQAISDLPGQDAGTGQTYGNLAAQGDENDRYAREQETFANNREQLLRMGINYDGLMEAAHRRHIQNLNSIDMQRRTAALSAASGLAGALADIAESRMGRQSAIYKAAAITQATIDAYLAINKTLSDPTIPSTPVRIAMATAIGISALANVASIAGLKDGGYVSGPGGPRDDKVPANLSNGEFVINADATSRNRALLEAINNGTLTARSQRASAAAVAGSAPMGGDTYQINVGDVNVQTGGGTSGTDGQMIGREVKTAIQSIVRREITDAKRSGGALTKTKSSVMSGS